MLIFILCWLEDLFFFVVMTGLPNQWDDDKQYQSIIQYISDVRHSSFHSVPPFSLAELFMFEREVERKKNQ